MQITVCYSAQARQAAKTSSEQVEISGPTSVRELLHRLVEKHDGLRRILLADDGEPNAALLLFVGDEQICDPAYELKAGDTLSILPPVAGG
ncbi:MAG: hypothetical protein KatS3mg105_2777 [Gemmatales bacterium]|nr:MAG: hypothetical protein KatS3mg105_2777 [Gemmatales bacterium]